MNDPKIGDIIYVDSHFYISHGSDDVVGGKATVTEITKGISGGKEVTFVAVKEHNGHSYNWTQFLGPDQEKLKERFGDEWAYPDPDIDTPWLEPGDLYSEDGSDPVEYKGPPIW